MKIFVIGGGASGMMAAITAANEGAEVTLLEKNEKLGKKLYITGKGRCNVFNYCSVDEFFQNVVTNPKFLYSAINKFSPYDAMAFFEKLLPLTIERGNRVFPSTNKSSDIIKVLSQKMKDLKVKVELNCEVKAISGEEFNFLIETNLGNFKCDKIIVATGGYSYQSTGSTGDGYKFAKSFNLKVEKPYPALCPIVTKQTVKSLEGLSLKNVELIAYKGDKKIRSEFGEMLFTHNGLSGPIAITMSSYINKLSGVSLKLDLKPALTFEILNNRILREFENTDRKILKSVVRSLEPDRLVDYVLANASLKGTREIATITKIERERLVKTLKGLHFDVESLGEFNNAIITSGGISVKELTPNMECKEHNGLFFVGETIDVDALTGGFNLQIAFSSGYVAGLKAASSI